MQEQVAVRQGTSEPPVVIKTTGLSVEAKEMLDAIARRAYEIFETKGRMRGHDLENWFEAESQLFAPTPVDVKESPESLTLLADVRHFAPNEVEVDLEPRRVTIIGRRQTQTERKTGAKVESENRATQLLRTLQLPVEIDTHHATARLTRGVLELDVRKAAIAKEKGALAGARSGTA